MHIQLRNLRTNGICPECHCRKLEIRIFCDGDDEVHWRLVQRCRGCHFEAAAADLAIEPGESGLSYEDGFRDGKDYAVHLEADE